MNGTKRDETIKQRVKDKQTEESGHRDHEKQTQIEQISRYNF